MNICPNCRQPCNTDTGTHDFMTDCIKVLLDKIEYLEREIVLERIKVNTLLTKIEELLETLTGMK